jgi:hypothetical protein
MAIALADVPTPTAEPLRIVDGPVTHGSVTLAIAETGGTLVLVRERVRGAVGADGKRSRENGTETDSRQG